MRSKLLPIILLLLLTTTAGAAVSYDIKIQNGDAHINATFQLYGGTGKYNYFSTTWQIPENATILSIRDSRGKITEYTRQDGTVQFQTNRGPKRNKETVQINYLLPDVTTTWKDALHTVSLQLPGFSEKFEQFNEEQTSVQITVPDPVLGSSVNHGFRSSYRDNVATFAGEGPVNLKVSYTDRTGQYDHYILFGEANLSRADAVYPLLNRITGRTVDFRKFAVVVVDGSDYSELFDPWIAGKYRESGVIFVKQSETAKNTFTGLVIHETMHGFNQKPLSWVRTQSSLFTEGTSEYAEWVVNTKLGIHQPEIFGETVEWRAPCKDSERTCIYSLDPRGTPDDLWQYYQQNSGFMAAWTPTADGQFRPGLSRRTFGYAFSELFIRRYIMKNGPKALHAVYRGLMETQDVADTPEEYITTLEQVMNSTIRPCSYDDRRRLEQCLEDANNFTPAVPSNVTINGTREQIVFKPVEVPDPEAARIQNRTLDRLLDRPTYSSRFWQGFIQWSVDGLTKFINLLSTLWH
ncbi:MAG: hypothetical protein SVU32_05575 [Candidatus Nanohaloarchaea archaeon]|nr:hypothetical protein [Candidatus Nanohaloarchaea archaeon]